MDAGVARITLDRTEAGNSLTPEMRDHLYDLFDEASPARSTRRGPDGAQRDPAIKALRDQITATLAANMRSAIDDAVATGERRAAPNVDDLVAQTIGPVMYRRAIEGSPAPDEFLDRLIGDALAPWLA